MAIYLGFAVAMRKPEACLFQGEREDSLLRLCFDPGLELLTALAPKAARELQGILQLPHRSSKDRLPLDLEIEYTRLFLGPSRPKAYPNEFYYLSHQRPSSPSEIFCVVQKYERERFQLRESFKNLPDHIIPELEFMAILCQKELEARQKQDRQAIARYLHREYEFLSQHLVGWIPQFCERVLTHATLSFYRALASLLKQFLAFDMNYLRKQLQAPDLTSLRRISRTAIPKRTEKSGQKNVSITCQQRIQVDSPACILCEVCSTECPNGALQLENQDDQMRLLFHPGKCDLCGVCVELCPTKAVRMKSAVESETFSESSWSELARAGFSRCQGCGAVISSEKFQQRVFHLLDSQKDVSDLRKLISLCETCKISRLKTSLFRQKERLAIRFP